LKDIPDVDLNLAYNAGDPKTMAKILIK